MQNNNQQKIYPTKQITITNSKDEALKNGQLKGYVQDQEGTKYDYFLMAWQSQTEFAPVHKKILSLPNRGIGMTVMIKYEKNDTYMNLKGIDTQNVVTHVIDTPPTIKSTPAPIQPTPNNEARGRVRHGIAVEAFKINQELTMGVANNIDKWTDYIMTGKLREDVVVETRIKPEEIIVIPDEPQAGHIEENKISEPPF